MPRGVGCAQNVRLRSANRSNGYNTWNVNSSGNVNNNNAANSWRFAPIVYEVAPAQPAHSAGGCPHRHKEPKPRPFFGEQYPIDAANPFLVCVAVSMRNYFLCKKLHQ